MGTNQEGAADGAAASIVDLNVGGVFYTTSLATLTKEPDSLLTTMFTPTKGKKSTSAIKDAKGKYFIDRDGVLFRYVLDYLRNAKIILPENFHERERLKSEAEYFQLPNMIKSISLATNRRTTSVVRSLVTANSDGQEEQPVAEPAETAGGDMLDYSLPGAPSIDIDVTRGFGSITLGYRGTFAFGRDGLADVKFRKLTRILICGRVSLCREVFGDTLNESRDPDRGIADRYTSRFFLKHNYLEQALDMLLEAGFRCIAGCASGTASGYSQADAKLGQDTEEGRWNHYNEFLFARWP